jgi:predicted component of type VI protein secretion system
MQDVIENSLDLIDEKYRKISDIHNIPVFFDSPEIKRLLREIEDTKYVILDIARNLSSTASNDKEDDQTNEVSDIE